MSDTPDLQAPSIRFDDGARYERYMGAWSQRAGDVFLDWLAPSPGLRWLDVGCGNGAFTERIVERCAPASVAGVDPSPEQIAHARTRPALAAVRFDTGDAMALPCADAVFDMAVMPLVIFFVPDPAVGVAEMARVLRPGGVAAAYAWDMPGGGFPYDIVLSELRARGARVPAPPSVEASRIEALSALWTAAGLVDVETRAITVRRRFSGFSDFWSVVQDSPSARASVSAMSDADSADLQARIRERLPIDADGGLTLEARANAVKGRVPDGRARP